MEDIGSSTRAAQPATRSVLERTLVLKLDLCIMAYCCLCYFFNYLDRAAFANAYVAGQKQDLGLVGNQYNILISMFTAGYVIAQIPHAVILQVLAPRIWIPTTMIAWSGLTMCSAACRNFSQLCAVRFFQGFMEASLYCGTMYVLGAWYTAAEMAKRTAIFTAIGQIGSMFAGIMMAAMNNTLDGSHGLSGWQWLYIINGASGIPFAFAGFILLPDVPEHTKAMYLSKSEVTLALERLPPKRKDGHKVNFRSLLPRVFKSRVFYIFITFSMLCGALEIFVTQGLLLLWINHFSERFPRNAANTYPLGIQAVAIMSNLLAGYYIDHTQNRVAAGLAAAVLQLVTAIMLLVPTLPTGGTLFAFYNSATSYIVNPLLFGWVNVIGQWDGDEALRAIVLYAMNTSQSVLLTFWGVLFLPADHAPYWRRGYIAMLVVIVLFVVFLFLAQRTEKRVRKRMDMEQGRSLEQQRECVEAPAQPTDMKAA